MPTVLAPTTDQRIIHNGAWEQFKLIQQGFNGSPGVRLSYYNETIEILTPGREHEILASNRLFDHDLSYGKGYFLPANSLNDPGKRRGSLSASG